MEDTQYNKGTVIVGAGGLGRELVSFIKHSNNFMDVPKVVGFIDDDKKALDKFDIDLKVIAPLCENDLNKYESILLAINNSIVKKNILDHTDSSKIKGFVHHSCIVGDRTNIHPSAIVFPNVLISCDTKVSRGVFVNCGSQIGHDVFIDECVNIMANVDIGGGCKIGKSVLIGTGAKIYPRLSIAENVVVGTGSVVFRSIKEPGTYIGNPAKKIF